MPKFELLRWPWWLTIRGLAVLLNRVLWKIQIGFMKASPGLTQKLAGYSLTANLLSKYDFSKFEWQRVPTSSNTTSYRRLLSGSETSQDIWNRFSNGEMHLYFGATIDVRNGVPGVRVREEALLKAARDAWEWVRWEVPTVGCRIEDAEDGSGGVWLVYQSPSPSGAKEWVERTFIVKRMPSVDLVGARRDVVRDGVPGAEGDLTWMYLILEEAGGKGEDGVRRFGVLVKTDHTTFDGVGLKVLLNRWLKRLVSSLCSPTGTDGEMELEWGKNLEIPNLLPSVFTILSPDEPRPLLPGSKGKPSSRDPYYASLERMMGGVVNSLQNQYGFKSRQPVAAAPYSLREELFLSKTETTRLLDALATLGEGYTLRHLAHAALALLVIHTNPPTPRDANAFLNNFSLFDGRSRLREPFNGREAYPGYALGIDVARVPVGVFFGEAQAESAGESADAGGGGKGGRGGKGGKLRELDRDTLVRVMKEVKRVYDAHLAMPCLLSYMAQAAEAFSKGTRQMLEAGIYQPTQNYMIYSDSVDRENMYLDHTYADPTGSVVLEIPRIMMSVNRTEPGPFFWISPWQGQTELSVDFNSNLVSSDEARMYLELWRGFMMLAASA